MDSEHQLFLWALHLEASPILTSLMLHLRALLGLGVQAQTSFLCSSDCLGLGSMLSKAAPATPAVAEAARNLNKLSINMGDGLESVRDEITEQIHDFDQLSSKDIPASSEEWKTVASTLELAFLPSTISASSIKNINYHLRRLITSFHSIMASSRSSALTLEEGW